jgi:predicted  nucleic acid-binding Zn-ribbon protein
VTVAKKLFELQQIDLDILREQVTLDEIRSKLGENIILDEARAQLEISESHLADVLKQQREMEWELDDLKNRIDKIGEKLYGGKLKNPKELVGLEHEIGTLKADFGQKEDKLLDVMGDSEVTQRKIEKEGDQVRKFEVEWRKEQKVLTERESDITGQLNSISKKRDALANSVPTEALELYEGIRARKPQVVVKVEQGMCQGCRLTLPMSEMKGAKAGNLVQCGSCGRILYLG